MEKQFNRSYIAAILIAITIAGSAFVYKFALQTPTPLARVIPVIGRLGSDHVHMSLLIMNKDKIVNFCSKEFMLRSQYVHFENNDCNVVHRHATGVTLPTFLKTIGVILSNDCLTLPNGEKHCSDNVNQLRAVVNGMEMPIDDLPYYVFKNNDHILLNYGPETASLLHYKYNQVPPIPADVNEPLNYDPYGKVIEASDTPLKNTE